MKALILAAGLGTRLRPWTLNHPKALVPVDGKPMLQRVASRLRVAGFNRLCVNIHHFGEQIVDWLSVHPELGDVIVSDERDCLLDTGGALVAAAPLLGGGPFLVHNTDILSTADLAGLMKNHEESGADVTLLVSKRPSSRHLWFDTAMRLVGWEGPGPLYKPQGFFPAEKNTAYAFSGIYVVGNRALENMRSRYGHEPFPVMNWLLESVATMNIRGCFDSELMLLDIGKPDALSNAPAFLQSLIKINNRY